MTINPRKKRSIRDRNVRHGTWERHQLKKLANVVSLTSCENCGEKRLTHRVCLQCGYYKGVQRISIKAKGSDTIVDA